MKIDAIEFRICPNCGSTDCIEDYPVKGKRLCVKCGHESVRMELKIVGAGQQILDNCPFCGKEGEEDDTLFEKDGIVVFRCKKCGKLDGYKFPDFLEYDPTFGRGHDSLSVKIAKQEGKFIHTASKYREFAEALRKKENFPVEKCKKQLLFIIQEKKQKMKVAGVSYVTIGRAKSEAQSFIERKGPLTNKKLKSLFPAALLLVQSFDLIRFGKTSGKKVTERQLETMFNVTRKTIRRWKKTLKNNSSLCGSIRLEVLIRRMEGQPQNKLVEIPEEIESVTRLEKPRKDKCDFCQTVKLLSWRFRYSDGSWSDICDNSYKNIVLRLRE